MTWNGTKITINGFNEIFGEHGVSSPIKDDELDIYTCTVGSTQIQAKTLISLSQKVIAQLIRHAKP